MSITLTIGPLLREWRQHRHYSQLDLSAASGVSQRHLSFVETGRAKPSRELVLHLAEALDVPLRDRNVLLQAAGFAPEFQETPLDDPEMESVRRAIDLMLDRHEPYPAVVLDRHWNVVQANAGAAALTQGWASPEAIADAAGNMLRLFAHPEGLSRYIVNLEELAAATAVRLRRERMADPADSVLGALIDDALNALGLADEPLSVSADPPQHVLALHLRNHESELKMFSTIATIGSPLDITVQELVIELFFPADAATERYFRERPVSQSERPSAPVSW